MCLEALSPTFIRLPACLPSCPASVPPCPARCVALFFTVIVLFSRFGLLLCALMLIALLYANFFLAPMLLLFGPATGARTHDAPPTATPAPTPTRDAAAAAMPACDVPDLPGGDGARGTELMPPAPSRNGSGEEH